MNYCFPENSSVKSKLEFEYLGIGIEGTVKDQFKQ